MCGLRLQPIGCTSALACDEQCYGSCSAASGAICVMPLPLYLYHRLYGFIAVLFAVQ